MQKSIARLASRRSGGLLLGIDDIMSENRSANIKEKSNLEDDVVLALAETMDLHMKANASATGTWEKEFASAEKGKQAIYCYTSRRLTFLKTRYIWFHQSQARFLSCSLLAS